MTACMRVLRWHEAPKVGRAHEHVCKLEQGHPVSKGSGVQCHECNFCTLTWESDPRPLCRCGPNQTHPACPIHGVRIA